MNNAVEQRMKFIEVCLIDFGSIKRETVAKYFGISAPQATRDLSMYDELVGGIGYSKHSKRYEKMSTYKPYFDWE